MVRVWRPQAAEPADGLHGTAVHLSSGHSLTFTSSESLIRFLIDAVTGSMAAATAPDGPAAAAT